MKFSPRLDKVRSSLIELHLDALIVTSLQDIRYLSGFSGSTALVLIRHDNAYIFLDFRYLTQAKEEVVGFEVKSVTSPAWNALTDCAKEGEVKRLGFVPSELSFEQYGKLEEKRKGMELVPTVSPIGPLRMIKDLGEVEAIRRSCRLVSQNLEEIRSLVRPGMREIEIAALFEYSLKMNGADGPGFETIVASGPRSAMPHAHPSQREVKSGDFLKMDGGSQWHGYHSDMTRTWVLGSATPQQKQIFQVVLEAHDQAVSAVRPGMLAEELDGVTRRVIEEAGYGAYFGHGTGHGVGLSVHEEPRIGKDSRTPLAEGMVFTIEPGIYLPGVGGVRIEDTVFLTEDGAEVLTTASREMTL